MDNFTHSFVGYAAAKAGLEKASPYATAVCVIAANAPDCDLLGYLGGRWFGFYHHRGITHSIVGVVALSLLLPTIFYAVDWWRSRREGRAVKVRWGPLFLVALLLTFSHPFLDWTNTYGVRPLLPWNGAWFYGDFAFVVEPFFWLVLGVMGFILTAKTKRKTVLWLSWATLAFAVMLIAPVLRGVQVPLLWPALWVAGAILAGKLWLAGAAAKWGTSIARVALALLASYLGLAWGLHRQAEHEARARTQALAQGNNEAVTQTAAGSLPGNPLRWVGLGETDKATYRFFIELRGGGATPAERFAKPSGAEAKLVDLALAQDEKARIWRNFARFPAARVQGDCLSETIVQFADLRFAAPGDGRSGSFAPAIPVSCSPEKAGN
jgi:inner membrane protein